MGFYITLRDSDGEVIRDLPDPFGGLFDASGDFDALVQEASSPTLAAIDPCAETVLASADLAGLASEVDALLADIPETAKAPGRNGAAWRGLTRFRVMVNLCQEDSTRTRTSWEIDLTRIESSARRLENAFRRQWIVVDTGSAARRTTSLADAVEMLDNAADTRMVCLRAEGFWLVNGGVEASLDHILDLSDVNPRNPRTNASIAKATIENWPDDPSQFAVELLMVSMAHPCPCCGHLTLDEPPGSYSICPVCFWEDDAVQLRWPTMAGGANRPSLIDAQAAYAEHGAMEGRFVANVRAPRADEPVEGGWRRIDLDRDSFEALEDRAAEWPDDVTRLYWWRSTFWRARRA